MDKVFLFSIYLISTMAAVLVSLSLLGFRKIGHKGIVIGLINGLCDYIIREVLVGKTFFFNGFHIITGTIIVFALCCYLLKIKKRAALFIPIVSYVIGAVSEIMVLILFIALFGKPLLEKILVNINFQALGGLISQLPVFILLLLITCKFKEFKLIDLSNLRRNS